MTIARHEGRSQICCDACPASYPNTYADEDFSVMIADAKTAGWRITRARPASDARSTDDLFGRKPTIAGQEKPPEYIHACPGCQKPQTGGRLF